jgi:hypothetical protein
MRLTDFISHGIYDKALLLHISPHVLTKVVKCATSDATVLKRAGTGASVRAAEVCPVPVSKGIYKRSESH